LVSALAQFSLSADNPHRPAPQGFRRHAAILNSAPGQLQQQSLLGIHSEGLPRRDAEESSIELIDAIDEAAPAQVLGERMGFQLLELNGEANNFADGGGRAAAGRVPAAALGLDAGEPPQRRQQSDAAQGVP
jgi:hypothetical protein